MPKSMTDCLSISWALRANRTRPAVKDINVVILLIADSGGLQNQENLLLTTSAQPNRDSGADSGAAARAKSSGFVLTAKRSS